MIVGIHQPHYFPWIGYFDKIAKSDVFILMDEVQLENRSYMSRNRFVNRNGELIYLSIPCVKKNYLSLPYREIKVSYDTDWQNKHKVHLFNTFRYSPYYQEVMKEIENIFENKVECLADITENSIKAVCKMLGIKTLIIKQSGLKGFDADFENLSDQREKEIIRLCLSQNADKYITGRGASLNFVDVRDFKRFGIELIEQDFETFEYKQRFTSEFIKNISILDCLFNIGIEETKRLFWENVKKQKIGED